MKLSLQNRIIVTVIVILILSTSSIYLMNNPLIFEYMDSSYEQLPLEDSENYLSSQHDQIKNLIINKNSNIAQTIKNNIEKNFSDKILVAHVIVKNNTNIYKSDKLELAGYKLSKSYDLIEINEDSKADLRFYLSFTRHTSLVTTDSNYEIYSYSFFYFDNTYFSTVYGIYNLLIIALLIIIVGILLYSIFKHMKKNTSRLNEMTKKIIQGDLSTKMELANEGDFTSLAESIDVLRQDLHTSKLEKKRLEDDREKMFSNIAHDIKTPITSIKGYAQILSEDYIKDNEIRKDYLDIMVNRCQVIENMVDDLREVIQYRGKAHTINPINFSIEEFLNDCINEFSSTDKVKKYEFRLDLDLSVSHIYADPLLLQRVFTNIIGNSIKYNPGKKINIDIKCREYSNNIYFYISDDGIGVPDNSLKKLFDRLYRVDSSRNSAIEGSGIGLAICKEIVEAHGGEINAFKKKGKLVIQFNIPQEEIL